MTKKKGYQLLDVPNNKRGRRFFEDFQEFLNKDWYGYHRRGRLPKPGVKLNWQGQAQVEDSSRWAIYVRGVPVSKEFLEHSARKSLEESRKILQDQYHITDKLQHKHDEAIESIKSLKLYLEMYSNKLNEKRFKLFGWNISLWKVKDLVTDDNIPFHQKNLWDF